MALYSDGEILRPKVLIVPREIPNPVVSGASVIGMLNLSGAKLYVITDTDGTWTALN